MHNRFSIRHDSDMTSAPVLHEGVPIRRVASGQLLADPKVEEAAEYELVVC